MEFENGYPVLPKNVYECLRWVITIVLPTLIGLFSFICLRIDIPNAVLIVAIANAATAAFGVIFGISKVNHDKNQKCTLDEGFGYGRGTEK
jgi:hypothetical protein